MSVEGKRGFARAITAAFIVSAAVSTSVAAPTSTQRPAAAAPAAATVTTTSGNSPVAKYLQDPLALRRGKLLFIGSCGAYCHSTKNVERDAPSLFDCEWRHGGSDQAIHDSIAKGVSNTRMPAWDGVLPQGDDDVWKLVAYLRSVSTCGAPSGP